ncbi:hypothetical protein [Pseudomonas serbica]|uniref:hypothetical protein n=1 Tax=Pseudomonas serbica TaxID=2965074 RepID=UPI00237ABB0B|nr:hypothetical protein [Pseudomonas serbica]
MKNDLLKNIGSDASPLALAAKLVLREALDNIQVHPCDEGDDAVAARQLPVEMQALLKALLDSQDEQTSPRALLVKIAERGTPADGHAFCTGCGSSRAHIAELQQFLVSSAGLRKKA